MLLTAFPGYQTSVPETPSCRWWLTATGLGLAFTINGFNGIMMFLGACAALWLSKAKPQVHEEYTVPVSSGIIAGESMMGVLIALLTVAGILGG